MSSKVYVVEIQSQEYNDEISVPVNGTDIDAIFYTKEDADKHRNTAIEKLLILFDESRYNYPEYGWDDMSPEDKRYFAESMVKVRPYDISYEWWQR